MVEFNLPSWDNAELVFQLRGKGHDFHKALATARNCNTLEEADKYFNQECPVCSDTYFIDDVSNLSYLCLLMLYICQLPCNLYSIDGHNAPLCLFSVQRLLQNTIFSGGQGTDIGSFQLSTV